MGHIIGHMILHHRAHDPKGRNDDITFASESQTKQKHAAKCRYLRANAHNTPACHITASHIP